MYKYTVKEFPQGVLARRISRYTNYSAHERHILTDEPLDEKVVRCLMSICGLSQVEFTDPEYMYVISKVEYRKRGFGSMTAAMFRDEKGRWDYVEVVHSDRGGGQMDTSGLRNQDAWGLIGLNPHEKVPQKFEVLKSKFQYKNRFDHSRGEFKEKKGGG